MGSWKRHIADAPSRAPLFAPADLEDMQIDTASTCLVTEYGKKNEFTAKMDSMDSDYVLLKNCLSESHYACQYKAVFEILSVDGELVYFERQVNCHVTKGGEASSETSIHITCWREQNLPLGLIFVLLARHA